jgi:hypothetical protein
MICTHVTCGKEEKVWVPRSHENGTDVEKHPWCKNCGDVKNISDDRPKNIGYWMNVLAIIASELDLAQVQKRLIAKKLQACEDLHDTYGTFGSAQEELFLSIVSEHCCLKQLDLETILYK